MLCLVHIMSSSYGIKDSEDDIPDDMDYSIMSNTLLTDMRDPHLVIKA